MTDDTQVDTTAPAGTPVETYGGGSEGVRQAARDLAAKREPEMSEAERAEIESALGEVAERRKAEQIGKEIVQATREHEERGKKESWSAEEASEWLSTERALARAQTQADLEEVLEQRRQAETQPQPQQPQEPSAEAQQRLNSAVRATQLQEADARAAQVLSDINLQIARVAAQAKQAFPEILGAQTQAEKLAALGNLSDARRAQFAQIDNHVRQLEGQAEAWAAERQKYVAINSGMAQRAQRAQYDAWARAEDQKAIASIPELSGPNAQRFQEAAVKVLETAGIPKDQMSNILSNPAYRSAAAQQVIAAATRAYLAKAELEAARVKKPIPKLQRPSNGNNAGLLQREVSSLTAKAASSGKLRDVAAAYSARKRAAARH